MQAPIGNRPKQIGLIVLQSDETLERDMRLLLPQEVEYLVTRVPSGASVSPDSLQAMEGVLTQAATLLPSGARFDTVAYGCTSGAAQIGADRVAQLVKSGVTTPVVTDPVSALIAACGNFGIARIGLVSPYTSEVCAQLRRVLADVDISVARFVSFEEPLEENVARISADTIATAAIEVGKDPDCDAVFLSCTNLRTLDVIAQVKAEISKPVLSSNQVLAWHLGQLAQFGHDVRLE